MQFQPSNNPGSNERHLLRQEFNPLFKEPKLLNQDTLMAAQEADHEQHLQFHRRFQSALRVCVELSETEDAEHIAQLKAELEHLYVVASSIGAPQTENKQAIRKLIQTINNTLRKQAYNDSAILAEIDQEEEAREMHFSLLESPLAADLLSHNQVILSVELVPTLLSTSVDELGMVMQIFDPQQLALVIKESHKLLGFLEGEGEDIQKYTERLTFIEGYSEFLLSNHN